MKALKPLLCVLLGSLAMAGTAQADADAGHCHKVNATGVGQDLGGGNTTATITHAGVLNGTTNAHFEITGGAAPVFNISGTVVFTTKKGTLTASVSGTFDVATGAFNASGPVTGGTAKLAGATGTLTLAGVEDLTTGAFTETITGNVCLPGGDAGEGDE
jgi:hypothetical protein